MVKTLEEAGTMSESKGEIEMRVFEPGDAQAFYDLNEEWISKHWQMEEHDYNILRNPVSYVIDTGGQIYVATDGGRVIGCCALVVREPGVFEVAKMAVAKEYRGRGVGRKLLLYTMSHASGLGAVKLTLASNSKLANAVHLYEALGFRHVPGAHALYARANVFMEMDL
jgi:putative acetyltransferase